MYHVWHGASRHVCVYQLSVVLHVHFETLVTDAVRVCGVGWGGGEVNVPTLYAISKGRTHKH